MSIRFLGLCLLSALASTQDDPSKQARDLIEKLRSDRIEDREEATRKLKDLGKLALQELEKAARNPDAEVAGRAKRIAQVIEIREQLTPNLLKILPGLEERLALGDIHTWTAALLEAVEQQDGRPRYPTLRREDLEPLAAPAAKGAKRSDEKEAICRAVFSWKLRTSAPEIVKFLQDDTEGVREWATAALGQIKAKEYQGEIVRRLRDDKERVRGWAAWSLNSFRARDSCSAIAPLLKDEAKNTRGMAARALGDLGAKEFIPQILDLLKDPESHVRAYAAMALGTLGASESVPEIVKLLGEDNSSDRIGALTALGYLRATERIPEVLKLLADKHPMVQQRAIEALGRMDAKTAAPSIAKLLTANTPDLRISAASWLCHLGCADGVSMLLDQSSDLSPLNALRRPDEWKQLHEKPLLGDLEGTTKELVGRLAAEAGLRLDWPKNLPPEVEGWSHVQRDVWRFGDRTTLLEGLRQVFDGPCGFVLEQDHIRVLVREEVVRFWRDWYAQQEKR